MNSQITTLSITPLPKPPPRGFYCFLKPRACSASISLSLSLSPVPLPRLLQRRRSGKWPPMTTTLSNMYIYHQSKAWKCRHNEKTPIQLIADILSLECLTQYQISCLASHLCSLRTIVHYVLILSIALGYSSDVQLGMTSSAASAPMLKSPWSIGNVQDSRANHRSRIFVTNQLNIPTISSTFEVS